VPTRVALRVLVLALAVLALPLSVVNATHGPTVEQVVSVAESASGAMDCFDAGGYQQCNPTTRIDRHTARISPVSGPLAAVATVVPGYADGPYFIDATERTWINLLQTPGCVDSAGIDKFIDGMLASFYANDFSYGPLTVGECSMTGELDLGPNPSITYCQPPDCFHIVTGTVLPSAFPTPTPRPTPAPTPRVTPTPVPTPTPTPTPTPSPTPTGSPSPSPSPTTEQSVAGITFQPQPTDDNLGGAPVPQGASGGTGGWADTVPLASQASTDPAAVGVSALFALLLLILMGFAAELFNNTLESHYDVVAGWLNKFGIGGGKAS